MSKIDNSLFSGPNSKELFWKWPKISKKWGKAIYLIFFDKISKKGIISGIGEFHGKIKISKMKMDVFPWSMYWVSCSSSWIVFSASAIITLFLFGFLKIWTEWWKMLLVVSLDFDHSVNQLWKGISLKYTL